MGGALKFRHTDIPRQAAERARLKVVSGPDQGVVFVMTGPQVSIGRGEENDVILSDLKASRRHAEISLTNNQWSMKDLGSANGILYNGTVTRATSIRTADVFTVGETTLEFLTAEMGTSLLKAVPRNLEEISADQKAFNEQQKRVRALANMGAAPTGKKAPGATGAKKPSPLLIGAVVIGACFYMFAGDPPAKPKKKPDAQPLANYQPAMGDTDVGVNKTADTFYRQGFREYMDGNYLRAKVQFETALQISPGHKLAILYLENCNKKIDEQVKFEVDMGHKNYESGKLKEAKNDYEAVLRLLYRDPANPNFIEAQTQLKRVETEMIGGSK